MDTPEVTGRCILCGLPLTFLPHFRGPVSIELTPEQTIYRTTCAKSDHGHLIQLLPGIGMEEARRATTSVALAEATEHAQRARNRAIAEAHEREMAELRGHEAVRGRWHEGTCVSCGMSDLPVIGLPGSEYCRYCEDLRVLKPPADAAVNQLTEAPGLASAWLLLTAFLLATASVTMTIMDIQLPLAALLFVAAFLAAKAA